MKNFDLSTAEAAKLANVSLQRMQRLCAQGRVVGAYSDFGRWRIPRSFFIVPGARGPRCAKLIEEGT